jgi:TolB-like protein/AraC-like DNA-binding protein/tetratricopeptide (TPR) repeat protein
MASNPPRDQKLINDLTEIVRANLSNYKFGVHELERKVGLSHFVLSRRLRNATGKTVTQFIREIRLNEAYKMLQTEGITAAEVAYKTGFGSPTYFNTCFNEYFGFPPGKIKKGSTDIKPEIRHDISYKNSEKKRSSGRITIYSSAVILSMVITLWLFTIKSHSNEADSPDHSLTAGKSIAVLPFKNLSDSAGNQYFADGITEDLLTLLSRIHDLRVVSRTSVEQFRNSKMSVSEIGKKLKAKYIIEGSVQKSGNMFRLRIQLVDAVTDHHVWAQAYDGKYSTDIFTFQSSIAKKVAASLDVAMTPREEQSINRNPTNEIQAYDLCMKGQAFTRKWDFDGDDQYLRLALNTFENALRIDPEYVIAILGKAIALVKLSEYDSSMVYYQKVLMIDRDNSSALGGIGGIYMYQNAPDSALAYFDKAIESNPNGEQAFWNYLGAGQVEFMYRNNIIKALSYYQKAFNLGGDSWPEIHNNISQLFSSLGDYKRAFEYMQTAVSLTSSCNYARSSLAILTAQGKFDEAFTFIDSIGRITDCQQMCDMMRFYTFLEKQSFEEAESFLGKAVKSGYTCTDDDYIYTSCLYRNKGRESADLLKLKQIVAREDSLIKGGKGFWLSPKALRVAAGYAVLGNSKKALEFLNLLAKYGCIDNSFPLKTFPGFDNIRDNPEFYKIVTQIDNTRDSLRAQVMELQLQGGLTL